MILTAERSSARSPCREDGEQIARVHDAVVVDIGVSASGLHRTPVQEDLQQVKEVMAEAWESYSEPIRREREGLLATLQQIESTPSRASELELIRGGLERLQNPLRRNLMRAVHDALVVLRAEPAETRERLLDWERG